jgi:hypothetical protein
VVFNIAGTNYTVNRAQCDLREAGHYVLCDVSTASNWSGLIAGTYTATATLYNLANNHTALTSHGFTIDSTRPTVSNFRVTQPASVYGNSVTVSADATDSSGIKNVTFYVTAPRVGDGVCDGNGVQLDSVIGLFGSGSAYTATLNTAGLNGDYCLNAIAEDAAANHSAIATLKAVFDNTAPDAPTLSSPTNNAVVNGNSITQSWSDSASDIDHYIYESYSNASASSLRFHATYNGTSKTATNVAETTYWWRVKAVDKAGNVSAWSPLWKITVDNTAPVVQITAPTGTYFNSNVTISGSLTDANPDHYYLVVKDSHGQVVAGPGTVNAASVADYIWDITNVADSTYTIDLEARDAAGNKDAGSTVTKQVIIDKTAPNTPVPDTAPGTYAAAQLVSLDSADSGSGLTGIYYTTDGSTPDNNGNGTLYTGAIALGLSSGTTTIKAVAYDTTGNASGVLSAEYTISPPALPSFTLGTGSNTPTLFATILQNGGNGGGTDTDGDTGDGAVLGASTTTPSTTNSPDSNSHGNVKGAATTQANVSKSAFLGLGWWWLLIFGTLGLIYAFVQRSSGNKEV